MIRILSVDIIPNPVIANNQILLQILLEEYLLPYIVLITSDIKNFIGSNGDNILLSNGEITASHYKSNYTGEQIDAFIGGVLSV
jgi:hypothetical protein